MTYRDLITKLYTLQDFQLDQEVKVMTEDYEYDEVDLLILEEDYVEEGECSEPISTYLNNPDYIKEPWELSKVAKKDDVYIYAK